MAEPEIKGTLNQNILNFIFSIDLPDGSVMVWGLFVFFTVFTKHIWENQQQFKTRKSGLYLK